MRSEAGRAAVGCAPFCGRPPALAAPPRATLPRSWLCSGISGQPDSGERPQAASLPVRFCPPQRSRLPIRRPVDAQSGCLYPPRKDSRRKCAQPIRWPGGRLIAYCAKPNGKIRRVNPKHPEPGNSPRRVQETPISLYHPDSSNFTRVQQEGAGVKRTALGLFREVGVSNGSLKERLVPADSQSRPFVEEAGLRPPAQGCDPALSDNPSPLIQPKCLQCATAVLTPLPRKSGGATLGNRANRVSTPPLRRRGGVVAALDPLGQSSDGLGSHWRGVPRVP